MNAEQAYLNTGIMPDDEPSGGEIPEEVRAFALRMLQHFKSEMKSAGYLH